MKADLFYLDQGRFSIVLNMRECAKTEGLAENINEIFKLDKSFIDEIHNPDYQVIVTNTVKMLKELNLKIVSEGVEAESQLQFLSDVGCDFIQGYYFSKPLPKQEFVSFVKQHC